MPRPRLPAIGAALRNRLPGVPATLLVLGLLGLIPPVRESVFGAAAFAVSWVSFDIPVVAKWIGILVILELAVAPLTRPFTRHLPDGGVAINKALGLFVVTHVAWIAGSLHLLPYSRTPAWVWIAVVTAIAYIRLWPPGLRVSRPSREATARWLLMQGVFLLIFLVYLEIQMHNTRGPLHFGDQGLDSAIVNAINRSEWFPPFDPSLAGFRLNYYYLGHLAQSMLARLTWSVGPVGYSMSMVTVISLTTAIAVSAGWALTGRRSLALLAGLAVGFNSNLEMLAQAISQRRWSTLDWGRPGSLIHGTLTSPPYDTYTNNELHAQFLALPPLALACATIAALALVPTGPVKGAYRWVSLVVAGLVMGLPGVTNLYSLPVPYALWIGVHAAAWLRHRSPRAFVDCGVGLAISVVAYLPFYLNYRGHGRAQILANFTPTPIYAVVTLFGVFIFALACWGYLSSLRWASAGPSRVGVGWLRVAELAVGIGIVFGVARGWIAPALAVYAAVFALCSERLVASALRGDDPRQVFAWVMATVSFGALLGIEVLTLEVPTEFVPMRFNIAWKTYLSVWIPLCLASVVAIGALARWPAGGVLGAVSRRAAVAAVALVLAGTLSGALYTFNRFNGLREKPGLDGLAYLRTQPPAERQALGAILWLNENAADNDVVLEAGGGRAHPYGRISSYTGLAAVLGWDTAVAAWQGSPQMVAERLTDIAAIYTNTNPGFTRSLLAKYRVRYIVIGALEEKMYGSVDRAGLSEIAPVVYDRDGLQILRVPDEVLAAR